MSDKTQQSFSHSLLSLLCCGAKLSLSDWSQNRCTRQSSTTLPYNLCPTIGYSCWMCSLSKKEGFLDWALRIGS